MISKGVAVAPAWDSSLLLDSTLGLAGTDASKE
jgi:hypothetical protein